MSNFFSVQQTLIDDTNHFMYGQMVWIMYFSHEDEYELNKVHKTILSTSFELLILEVENTTLNNLETNQICFYLGHIFEKSDFAKILNLLKKINWFIEKDYSYENYKKTLIELNSFLKNIKMLEKLNILNNFDIQIFDKHWKDDVSKFISKYKSNNWNEEFNLYPKQLKEAYFLYKLKHGALFSVPGTGKTITTLATYNAYKYSNPNLKGIVLVGPSSSFLTWIIEWQNVFGKQPDYKTLSGMSKYQKDSFFEREEKPELLLMHYSTFANYSDKLVSFFNKNNYMLVIDEAHYLKNESGMWGTNARRMNNKSFATAILTGTPLPNGYKDLNNYYRIMYPDIISNYIKKITEEINQFYRMTTTKTNNDLNNAAKKINPFYCRTTKKDLGMKNAKFIEVFANLDQQQFENAQKIIEFYTSDKGKNINYLALAVRLIQNTTSPNSLIKPIEDSFFNNQEDKSINIKKIMKGDKDFRNLNFKKYEKVPNKIIIACNLTQDLLAKKERIILWTWFQQTAKNLKRELFVRGIKSHIINGTVKNDDRQRIIKEFKKINNNNVLIASLQTLSESVSLNRECQNAIFVEYNFDFAKFEQAQNRIHRYDKSNPYKTVNLYIIKTKSLLKKEPQIIGNLKLIEFDQILFNILQEKHEAQADMIDNNLILPINNNSEDVINDIKKEILQKWNM